MRAMDFDLSADQQELQDAARHLLDDHAGSTQVRAHLASGDPYDGKLWSAMAEQGWCAVAVAADEGGLGLGWVEAAVLLEEVGRHVAPVPLAPQLVTLAALSGRSGHDRLRERLLSGSALGAVAWTARPGVVTGGDGAGLTGRLGPVEGASAADVLVVVVPDGVHLVDLGATGRPPAQPAMDLTRSLSWVDLDATPAVRIGGPGASARLGALGALATSAELLGGAGRVLEMATQYAKDRIQFGVPIGSFQAVKHRCADMLVDVEGMRSSTWYAAWAAADRRTRMGAGGVHGQGLGCGRLQAGDVLGPPGPRRHRLHLGARSPPVHQAGPVLPARLRRRRPPPDGAGRRPPLARGGRRRGHVTEADPARHSSK